MARVINKGYTDTATTATTLTRGALNFAADFRASKHIPGETTLTNITSPLDRPEIIQLKVEPISNIYARSSINPVNWAVTKKGVTVYVSLSQTWLETDTVDLTYNVQRPVNASLKFSLPADGSVVAADIPVLAGRLVSRLFASGSTSTAELDAILRGVTLPKEL